jgi:hypothetical protein
MRKLAPLRFLNAPDRTGEVPFRGDALEPDGDRDRDRAHAHAHAHA